MSMQMKMKMSKFAIGPAAAGASVPVLFRQGITKPEIGL